MCSLHAWTVVLSISGSKLVEGRRQDGSSELALHLKDSLLHEGRMMLERRQALIIAVSSTPSSLVTFVDINNARKQ